MQANRINRAFPRFSVSWLMGADGEGPGYVGGASVVSVNGNPIISLPVYINLSLVELAVRPVPDSVIYLSQSLSNNGTFASFYNSDALSPKLQRGALLLLRPCAVSDIIWDCLYYVVTAYSRSYRIIKRGKDKNHVFLTSCRPEIYPDKQLALDGIRELYLICAVFNLTYPID